jgi:hypothetical protein
MLKLIVSASSDAEDIVLDPFCGSGTTLHAARDLGRSWIGIDSSLAAAEAVCGRLTKGLEPMGDFVDNKIETDNMDLFSQKADTVGSEKLSAINANNDFHLLAEESLAHEYGTQLTSLLFD